jgi:hypothetical protein
MRSNPSAQPTSLGAPFRCQHLKKRRFTAMTDLHNALTAEIINTKSTQSVEMVLARLQHGKDQFRTTLLCAPAWIHDRRLADDRRPEPHGFSAWPLLIRRWWPMLRPRGPARFRFGRVRFSVRRHLSVDARGRGSYWQLRLPDRAAGRPGVLHRTSPWLRPSHAVRSTRRRP